MKTVTEAPAACSSAAQALALCTTELGKIPDPLGQLDGLASACASKVQGKTESQALSLIPNTLAGILAWL